ncbi:MAG: hypothetical protein M1828_001160 [Chrysothrix sp. TS-e1954]|nr:MAG: hypothetical protein M1828_001160 [Chrysothrix sp. TS-e1954]
MPSSRGQRSSSPDFDDDDHRSITASLEDFEGSSPRDSPRDSPILQMPSQHSGFRSTSPPERSLDREPSEFSLSDSAGPWSPPAWRRQGAGWFEQHDQLGVGPGAQKSPSHSTPGSRQSSPGGELILPASVALPPSPEKGRSPEDSPESDGLQSSRESSIASDHDDSRQVTPKPGNCKYWLFGMAVCKTDAYSSDMRLAFRADVQHRTDFIESALTGTARTVRWLTRSWSAIFCNIMMLLLVMLTWRNLVSPPALYPGPDLVKVAGLARSFEPLIHYSENGVTQVTGLQETGVAVWDLGESVRSSTMTSGPIICNELDQLSGGLKTLALELTRFFASVDGDVDSILIVMDWARRELLQLLQPGHLGSGTPNGNWEVVMENVILFAHRIGGPMLTSHLTGLFGRTPSQVSRETIQRTFHEFLSVLESSINQELKHSTALFGLFEAIDRQFLNLHRAAARELNTQQSDHDSDLATIWSRTMGPNKDKVSKYETNRELLLSVRGRTLYNKQVIGEHNQRLLDLQANLDILRQRLVSPLVRSENSSLLGVKEQIEGLEGVYEYLKSVREGQRDRILQARLGVGNMNARSSIGPGDDASLEMVKQALVSYV